MKHEKEWRTCDRCGAEMKKEYCAEIRLQRMVLNVTYDLCCECMEDFERFMKNDCKYQ